MTDLADQDAAPLATRSVPGTRAVEGGWWPDRECTGPGSSDRRYDRDNLIVRRVLGANGIDRLIPMYPSLEAAVAAGVPAEAVPVMPEPGGRT